MTHLTSFLAGEEPDTAGRMIGDIWRKPETWLESRHDFIQWLFPLPEPSGANLDAPLLTPDDAARIAASVALRQALLTSTDTMMRLYGIRRVGDMFSRGEGFPGPFSDWLGPIDHNHLRFTRMLRCLALCGLGDTAQGLRGLLFNIAATEALGAWSTALRYWRDAGLAPPGWPVGA
ncbi:opioid growth factor receptor-related protein [Zavarzinia aquatilis]|uniref:opioid growth factor receptor-related protein n=1 Tax=Zavarzinia aquatilis TaxID=2211142 RepID=UPI0010577303|nr:opioid growth factor receptor-related protein [Zavarzinia aquatilis]